MGLGGTRGFDAVKGGAGKQLASVSVFRGRGRGGI